MAVLVNVPWPYFMIRYGRTFSTNTIPEFALPKRDLERWDTRCRHRMANRGQRLTQGGIPAAAKSQNYAKKAALALRPNKKAHGGGGGGEGEGKVEGEGEGYDADDDDGEAQDPKKPRISDWEHEFWGGLDGSEAEALARANGGSLNDFASTSRDIYPEPLCDPGEASEVRVGIMNLITR